MKATCVTSPCSSSRTCTTISGGTCSSSFARSIWSNLSNGDSSRSPKVAPCKLVIEQKTFIKRLIKPLAFFNVQIFFVTKDNLNAQVVHPPKVLLLTKKVTSFCVWCNFDNYHLWHFNSSPQDSLKARSYLTEIITISQNDSSQILSNLKLLLLMIITFDLFRL